MSNKKQLRLGLFLLLAGHHSFAWRLPAASENRVYDFEYAKQLAQTAEKGKLDAIFLADHLSTNFSIYSPENSPFGTVFEPLTLLSSLAAVTEKIGLIGTTSTTFSEPYNVARKFASLDLLSNGRAGWNVVTSYGKDAAQNFGMTDVPTATERYDRADEFLNVTKKLWDSWEDDAFAYDQANCRYVDTSKIHEINHEDKWFSVKGPLNLPRTPQGYPVIVQAGSSDTGREFAAKHAEIVFTAWSKIEDARKYYSDVKGRMRRYGRNEEDLIIMPGLMPIVGRTEEEALEKKKQLDNLVPIDIGVKMLSEMLNTDLSVYPVDGYLPDLVNDNLNDFIHTRYQIFKDLAENDKLTIREMIEVLFRGRGQKEIIGTPVQIADQMQEWLETGAADGFNLLPPTNPSSLEDFIELVVPELQKRGIFKTEYTGNTFRENLGLDRPSNQFVKLSLQ